MRYDKLVKIVYESEPSFNYSTGRYDNLVSKEIERMAHISDQSDESMNLHYGKIVEQALIFRFKGPKIERPINVIYDNQKFSVTKTRATRDDYVIYGAVI